MSDRFDTDPETLADIRLRESTSRDNTRSRAAASAFGDGAVIGEWPCANGGCRKPCELTQAGYDAYKLFNAQLERRGDRQLLTSDALMCPDCKKLLDDHRAEKNRKRDAEVSELVREYRFATGKRMGEIELRLTQLKHPDVAGLVESVRSRREKPGTTPRKDRGL